MRFNLPLKILTVLVITLLMVLLLAYCVIGIIIHGPSKEASRVLVTTLMETSAAKFVPRLYLSDEEIEDLMGIVEESTDIEVNPGLIDLPLVKDNPITEQTDEVLPEQTEDLPNDDAAPTPDDGIEIHDVKGSTYNGKMMIISDPTRVFVGIPENGFGKGKSGETVFGMIARYGATAGTNAGGFDDPGGSGTGGIPEGIVIYEGELLWGQKNSYYSLAGLDANGLLHVGKMTAKTALDKGIVYAASYGPALIINGEPQQTYTGGLNPRTAIGQRADGAILLLVINGRSVNSLGASLDDLVEIFVEYGAVNATNLDGGSSSIMIYDGEYITNSAYIHGERVVATSILVK